MKTFLAAATAAALLISSTAIAADAARVVSFCGTVVKLAPGGCIGVKSSMVGGPTYNITGTKPAPSVGTMIAGFGTPGTMHFCGGGVGLSHVMWRSDVVCPFLKDEEVH